MKRKYIECPKCGHHFPHRQQERAGAIRALTGKRCARCRKYCQETETYCRSCAIILAYDAKVAAEKSAATLAAAAATLAAQSVPGETSGEAYK